LFISSQYVLRLDLFSYNKIDKFLKTVVKK
jgi:hypothetical protein